MRFACLLVLSVALSATSSQGFAQSATGELRPGVSVRVRPDGPNSSRVKGTLVSATRDSLVIASDDINQAFARRDLRELEVKRRRSRTRGALRLATWVGVISAALFTPSAIGTGEYQCGRDLEDQCRNEGNDFGQIVGFGFLLSLYGQAIGAIWPGREWLKVDVTSSATGNFRPPARGSRVRITAPGYTAPLLEGVVGASSSDSLSLIVRSTVINVPMTAVTQLQYGNEADRTGGVARGLLQATPLTATYLALALQEHTSK